ncbi:hypothetical protein DVK05_05780 [Halorubrum sp. Atlit-8R]|nr:hypothetical protein DVK05_05780 [Halorubrum sp. Atlit-8R]
MTSQQFKHDTVVSGPLHVPNQRISEELLYVWGQSVDIVQEVSTELLVTAKTTLLDVLTNAL